MSYGGCDFGPKRNTQFTPNEYRSIGEATALAISDLLLSRASLAAKEVMMLLPPPDVVPPREKYIPSQITIEGESREARPAFFHISPTDLTVVEPHAVRLTLRQFVRDSNPL
jgi:hypothetical protein